MTEHLKVLVCGDRNWTDGRVIYAVLDGLAQQTDVLTVIEGGARGTDAAAARWARSYTCYHEQYPADWDLYGKAAGPIRNGQMLREGRPDQVWAFHDDLDGVSRGTKNMVAQAKKKNIPVYIVSHG